MEKRLLPIGIQSFEKLRENHCVYVDKTEYVYRLVHDIAPFFLSRPRRFGKSLLLSTLKAYWKGKKELFRGLAIEKLEETNPDAWKKYPVFYFDFNSDNYHAIHSLENVLDAHLSEWESEYNISDKSKSYAQRFRRLLKVARSQTGLRCVVLVDEYDKPLLDLMENSELQEHNKAVFKGFFKKV